jgi:hypothetical protein
LDIMTGRQDAADVINEKYVTRVWRPDEIGIRPVST